MHVKFAIEVVVDKAFISFKLNGEYDPLEEGEYQRELKPFFGPEPMKFSGGPLTVEMYRPLTDTIELLEHLYESDLALSPSRKVESGKINVLCCSTFKFTDKLSLQQSASLLFNAVKPALPPTSEPARCNLPGYLEPTVATFLSQLLSIGNSTFSTIDEERVLQFGWPSKMVITMHALEH